MPERDHDQYLWDTFCQFWPPWKKNVEEWRHHSDNTIIVKMKKGDFVNSGYSYLFGDDGVDAWHLERITHPANVTV